MRVKKTAHLMRSCSAVVMALSATIAVGLVTPTLNTPIRGCHNWDEIDPSGVLVADATVTISAESQGFTRSVTSSSSGKFRFAGLPSGEYSVSITSSAGDM